MVTVRDASVRGRRLPSLSGAQLGIESFGANTTAPIIEHGIGLDDMAHQPTTVLIAEDDPVFRRVMGFSIARSGLTVESVSNGQTAYERLCQGGIRFLVTDHQMPICSGLELIEKLDSNPAIQRPPTILCTAKGLELDSQGIESRYGLVAVMHKPFSPRKLGDLILKHIGLVNEAGPIADSPNLGAIGNG